MRQIVAIALKGFAWAWMLGLTALHLAGLWGIVQNAPTWYDAWVGVTRAVDPFNWAFYMVLAVVAAPAVGAMALAERITRSASAPSSSAPS